MTLVPPGVILNEHKLCWCSMKRASAREKEVEGGREGGRETEKES